MAILDSVTPLAPAHVEGGACDSALSSRDHHRGCLGLSPWNCLGLSAVPTQIFTRQSAPSKNFPHLLLFLTTSNMSAPINKEKVQQEKEEIHKIRITLTSTKVKQLEKVSANIINNAAQNNLVKKGPVRMPTKVLRITSRKAPNGEGSKTYDTYEMRIHKRVIDLQAPASTVKRITQITVEPGVDVEVTVAV